MAAVDLHDELATAEVPDVTDGGNGGNADAGPTGTLAAVAVAADTDADANPENDLADAFAASIAVNPSAVDGEADEADKARENLPGDVPTPTPAFVQGCFEYIPEGPLASRPLQVHHYGPANNDARREAQVVFIMHGSKRDAVRYMNGWRTIAERQNLLLVAPEFTKDLYWGRNDFQMGNVFTYESDYTDMNPEAAWTFNLIEPLFDYAKEVLGNASEQYLLWGHSAGGQFVHRFLMFVRAHRCSKALSANVGIWTVPDPAIRYPFGLAGTPVVDAPMDFFKHDHTIMVGNDDNTLEGFNGAFLNGAEAHKQGANRVARTDYFTAACRATADERQLPLNWRLVHVNNMSHQAEKAAAVTEKVWFLGSADDVLDAED